MEKINNKKLTSLFFIDGQGFLNSKEEWLLRGGFIIEVSEYIALSKKIISLEKQFFGEDFGEIKWSDLSLAIHLKNTGYNLSNHKKLEKYAKFNNNELEKYIRSIFQILSALSLKTIIVCISHRHNLKKIFPNLRNNNSLMRMQLNNLLDRAKYYAQEKKLNIIIIHDNESSVKHDKRTKNTFKSLLFSSQFIRSYDEIVDNLFIDYSHQNSGIRVADFIVGAVAGALREYSFSREIFSNYIFPNLKIYNNNVIGSGLVLIPSCNKDKQFCEQIINILNLKQNHKDIKSFYNEQDNGKLCSILDGWDLYDDFILLNLW